MKKHYSSPQMQIIRMDEFPSLICTSGPSVTMSAYGEDDTGGFTQESAPPHRNSPWDE